MKKEIDTEFNDRFFEALPEKTFLRITRVEGWMKIKESRPDLWERHLRYFYIANEMEILRYREAKTFTAKELDKFCDFKMKIRKSHEKTMVEIK